MDRAWTAWIVFLVHVSLVLCLGAPPASKFNRPFGLPMTAKDRSAYSDKPAAAPTTAAEDKPKLVLTDATEVTLDGAVCKFADVPGDADIVSLSVAADKKTILKIEFKSKVKP